MTSTRCVKCLDRGSAIVLYALTLLLPMALMTFTLFMEVRHTLSPAHPLGTAATSPPWCTPDTRTALLGSPCAAAVERLQ